MPFDVAYLRSIRYELSDSGSVATPHKLRRAIANHFILLRKGEAQRLSAPDSPLFQLLEGWRPGSLASVKTDVFREQVEYSEQIKAELAAISRMGGRDRPGRERALREMADLCARLGPFEGLEAGVLVDILLTYRTLEYWDGMIAFVGALPEYLQGRVLVQEQLALALNRRAESGNLDDRDRALQILKGIESEHGQNAETSGLIGRVHKDQWSSWRTVDPGVAAVHLDDAILAYRRGFTADPTDPYPGINLLTLLEVRGDAEAKEELGRMLPVVEFAARRLLDREDVRYWVSATLLELAVLRRDEPTAVGCAARIRARSRNRWEAKTTLRNIELIVDAREGRLEDAGWIRQLLSGLGYQEGPDAGGYG